MVSNAGGRSRGSESKTIMLCGMLLFSCATNRGGSRRSVSSAPCEERALRCRTLALRRCGRGSGSRLGLGASRALLFGQNEPAVRRDAQVILRPLVLQNDLPIRAEKVEGCDPAQPAVRRRGLGIAYASRGLGSVVFGAHFRSSPPVSYLRGLERQCDDAWPVLLLTIIIKNYEVRKSSTPAGSVVSRGIRITAWPQGARPARAKIRPVDAE